MYVFGEGGVKDVSEHLEDFITAFGMFCSRTLNVLRVVYMYMKRPKNRQLQVVMQCSFNQHCGNLPGNGLNVMDVHLYITVSHPSFKQC